MLRTLKALLGLAAREDATTGELAPSLPAAEAELAAAQQAQADAEQAYSRSLLGGSEAETLRLDVARREAAVRIDRATALIEALRERLAEAREHEAEAERVTHYEAARIQAEEARQALAEHYENMAADIVRLLEVVASAELVVSRVNAELPRGALPLLPVERTVRDIPAGPDEIISEIEVERWVEVGFVKPGSFDQKAVYVIGPGRGVIPVRGLPMNECRQVELRTFTERQSRKGASARIAYRLAQRIALPGFRDGEPDYWKPMDGQTRQSEVLEQAQKLHSRAPSELPVPSASTGKIETVLVPAPGAEAVKAVALSPPTRRWRGADGEDKFIEAAE